MRGALDCAEAGLARAAAALERPGAYHVAAGLLVVLAFLVRLPLAAVATDVSNGHPDSWVYFHQAYVHYLDGDIFPDAHRGSGWQLLLFATLYALGYAPGAEWTPYFTPMTGEAASAALVAHTLSACLSAGAVAATLLLARELVSRKGALLAAALVALDPFLLRNSTSAMSEPLYVPLFVLGVMTVLRARRHPAWLLATGALMALAHVMRVTGLIMFVALALFGFLLLRTPLGGGTPPASPETREPELNELRRVGILGLRPAADPRTRAFSRVLRSFGPRVRRGVWGDTSPQLRRQLTFYAIASVATFLFVASPYLIWRDAEGAGAFDYGTNQRFWADDLWDLDDAWWQADFAGARIPRESMQEYFSTHTLGEAATRLGQSVAWQVFDLFGSGRYPAWMAEGGAWVGSPQEESALTPLVAGLALVAAFTAMKRREWWFLPIALGVTFLTFLWIYPLVRSVRYFAPLIPLFSIAAAAGWTHLRAHVRRPMIVGVVVFGTHLLLYGLMAVLHVPDGLRLLAGSADARAIVAVTGSVWMLVALAPALDGAMAWARRARVGERRIDEAP